MKKVKEQYNGLKVQNSNCNFIANNNLTQKEINMYIKFGCGFVFEDDFINEISKKDVEDNKWVEKTFNELKKKGKGKGKKNK